MEAIPGESVVERGTEVIAQGLGGALLDSIVAREQGRSQAARRGQGRAMALSTSSSGTVAKVLA
jgi:hypothetical protein